MSLLVRSAPGALPNASRPDGILSRSSSETSLHLQGWPAASIPPQGAPAMTTFPLGIDISKRKFDACLINDAGQLRHQIQPLRQRPERAAAGERQVPDAGHRGGDAQARPPRLRRAEERQA